MRSVPWEPWLPPVAVYGVLLVKLGCLDEDELHQMPGGTRLLQVFRKLRLM